MRLFMGKLMWDLLAEIRWISPARCARIIGRLYGVTDAKILDAMTADITAIRKLND